MDATRSYEALLRDCNSIGLTAGPLAFVVLTTLLHPYEVLDPMCSVEDDRITLGDISRRLHPATRAVLGGSGTTRDLLHVGSDNDRTTVAELNMSIAEHDGPLADVGLHNLVPAAAAALLATASTNSDRRAVLAHVTRSATADEQHDIGVLLDQRLDAAGYTDWLSTGSAP